MSRGAILLLALSACSPEPPPRDPELEAFLDAARPPAERVRALRALRARDPEARRRAYPAARPALERELGRGAALSMSEPEAAAFVEAAAWLGEMKEGGARVQMELYLDREFVRQKRLPDPALRAAALALGHYPESESAREVLWAGLRDAKEKPDLRAACLKSLQSSADFERRILEIKAEAGDEWLPDLQKRLRP